MHWKMKNSLPAALVLTGLAAAIILFLVFVSAKFGVVGDAAAFGSGIVGALIAYLVCCQMFPRSG